MKYFEFKQSNSGMINDNERENKSEKLLKLKSDGKTGETGEKEESEEEKRDLHNTIAN